MKKTLLAGAIAAFAITPALAQQGWTPHAAPIDATGQVVGAAPERAGPPVHGSRAYSAPYASGAYASGPYAYVEGGSPAFFGGQLAVSTDGQIIGADPDPSIRSDLQRNQDLQLGRGSS